MRLEGPILLDSRVTEVFHLPQHGSHEGRPQLPCICDHFLSLLVSDVFSCSCVEVVGGQAVKEATATLHVPMCENDYQVQIYPSWKVHIQSLQLAETWSMCVPHLMKSLCVILVLRIWSGMNRLSSSWHSSSFRSGAELNLTSSWAWNRWVEK